MTATLAASYKETLDADTVVLIEYLLEKNYDLSDMLKFISERSEDDFLFHYEAYCHQGEFLGFDVVNAFVLENGIGDVRHCMNAYVGTYESKEEFVEEYMVNSGDEEKLPHYVVVDYTATWENALSYDYNAVDYNGWLHFFHDRY